MSVESLIERSKLKIPELPGSFDNRVFIGGNYDFMPILREIKKYVEETGFTPILAFDIKGVPKDKIHDFDIGLLKLCKYAVFDVSSGDGHMMEIEAAIKLFGTVVFGVYMVRGRRHKKPSPLVSSMLTTAGVPMIRYSDFEELRRVVEMIFPGIEESPDSTWLLILDASWMLPEVKSRIVRQLSMDGVPRVDFVASSLHSYVERLCNVLSNEYPRRITSKLKEKILGVFERQKSLYYIEDGLSEPKVLSKDFGTIIDALKRLDKLPTNPQTLDFRCALSIALARLVPSREALEILKRSAPTPKQPLLSFEYHLCVATQLYDVDAFDGVLSEVSKALEVEGVGSEDVCRGKLLQAGVWINLFEYGKAISILGEILEKSLRRDIILQARFLRASALQESCEYKDSLKEYVELLKKRLPLSLELAIHNNKGILRSILGEPKEALSEWEKTLKLSKEDKRAMAGALGNMGIVLRQLGELKKALEHHEKALRLNEELGHGLGIASCLQNIGIILAVSDQPQKALDLLKQALNIFNKIGATIHAQKVKQAIKIIKQKQSRTK